MAAIKRGKAAREEAKRIASVGQPRLYDTPESMQVKIDEYFASCEQGQVIEVFDRKTQDVKTVVRKRPLTIEGLAVHLGMTRTTLLNYTGDPEYVNTITRAKEKILSWKWETAWNGDVDPRVLQFDLKNNHGYKDESEHNIRQTTGAILPDPVKFQNEDE